MPMQKKIDFIIVGQGLAGSLLAIELINRGASILIIDQHHQHSASKVAAGLLNPLTGKRLSLHPLTDQFLAAANQLYKSLEEKFSAFFLHNVPMLRLLKDQQQFETLQKKISDPALTDYLASANTEDKQKWQIPFGAVKQLKTGYLDIPLLLASLKDYFTEKNALILDHFDYQDIQLTEKDLYWKDYRAKCCIFCEGYQAINNPWFSFLPFQPAKGEILTLESDEIDTSYIINRGNWLIPIGNKQYRCGSTNEWTFLNDEPTSDGKQHIETQLNQLFKTKPQYTVTQHHAGIRPATRDKNPFIGRHPQRQTLAMFNGFGARGSLTIPYYAAMFAEHLQQEKPLTDNINIKRYYS